MAASKEIDENIKHNLINAPSVGKEKFIKLEGFIELVKLLTFQPNFKNDDKTGLKKGK